MPRNSGHTQRDLLGGAGKGDADRSPGWRLGYDDIDWGSEHAEMAQLKAHGIRTTHFRRTYGPVEAAQAAATHSEIFHHDKTT